VLGHKGITMTPRYAHLSNDQMRAAVGKLERVPTIFTTPPNARQIKDAQAVEFAGMGR
jgi:hypothetical protein